MTVKFNKNKRIKHPCRHCCKPSEKALLEIEIEKTMEEHKALKKEINIKKGMIVQAGKRRFVKIKPISA